MNPDSEQRDRAARHICATLRASGFRAVFAGGCVRDHLLGVPAQDLDIATDARPEQIMALFDRTLAVGAQFGVVIVVLPEGTFEVATFRKDHGYSDGRRPDSVTFTEEMEDARRRDFTINALFLDPETNDVLDYVGGIKDLRAGLVRAVGDAHQRFSEDRLRLLRAIRFSARLGYVIEATTLDAIRANASYITATSAERIREELLKMLTEGSARRAFELLDETGLLGILLPEIVAMKGVEQPAAFHPEGDVFVHTLGALEKLPGGVSPTLALAALLHDVGKPATQTIEDRIRFNLHEKVGARISEDVCRRLRMPVSDTARIVWLVENHMRLLHFFDMREHRRRRLARHRGFDELLSLCRIDAQASHGDESLCDAVATWRNSLEEIQLKPQPLLTGKDLIALGYRPGPLFKHILDDVEAHQLDGTLNDKAEAESYVRRRFPQ